MIDTSKIVKINKGLFKGHIGMLTGSFLYNNKKVNVITLKQYDNTCGQFKNAVVTLFDGEFEQTSDYKSVTDFGFIKC